ncbi:hypothetical protein, partial [Pseudoxanthomonas spadix]
ATLRPIGLPHIALHPNSRPSRRHKRLLGDYRRQFREHLAVLAEPDTADRMREFMDRPWALQRPISAGEDD